MLEKKWRRLNSSFEGASVLKFCIFCLKYRPDINLDFATSHAEIGFIFLVMRSLKKVYLRHDCVFIISRKSKNWKPRFLRQNCSNAYIILGHLVRFSVSEIEFLLQWHCSSLSQWQVNHGTERNVEFSLLYEPLPGFF